MKVLIADDDQDHVAILRFAFELDGHKVVTAFDGAMAWHIFEHESPDLVVLDLNMPKQSGMDVLQRIRLQSKVPVIVLSVVTDENKIVGALDSGADDYVLKPFSPRELRARTRALLRRSQDGVEPPPRQLAPISLCDFQLDPRKRQVIVSGELIHLTRTEFELLYYLILNHDNVLREADIVANVWGYDAEETDEVVRVTIHRLRRKIDLNPSSPSCIITVTGVGYMFQSQPCPEIDQVSS